MLAVMANVVLFMSDEHNPFVSSPYGHPLIRTPHMQKLANDGLFCENAYCPSPICLASRSAFVSGRRVHEIRAYSNCLVNVPKAFPSYARVLGEQGVHTIHMGKLDVYDKAENLGFSEVYEASPDRQYPGDRNIGRTGMVRKGASARANGYGPRSEESAYGRHLRIVDCAVEWLHERAPTIHTPWVLSINIGPPHFPHYTTPELWEFYAEAADLPVHGADEESACHPRALDLRRFFESDLFTEEQVRGLRRGYLGCVDWVDQQLGRVRAAVEAAGLGQDTNIIYASDHGDMLGKFGMWWKCSLYEDSVRVPCIAAGPDFAGPRRVRTPVDLHDLRASLFHATGTVQPPHWIGQPLQEITENDQGRTIFSEYHGQGVRASSFLLRRGRWKYLHHCEAPSQLFDLEEDPQELHNQAETRPEIVGEMKTHLSAICSPEEENRRASAFVESQLRELAKQSGA